MRVAEPDIDELLLSRAQSGDRPALDELCRREWQPVYGIAYHALGNAAEAQDLTQETFLRALRSLDRYHSTGAPFRAYLATIARNLIRDGWRSRKPVHVDLDHAAELHETHIGPEEAAIRTDEQRRLLSALSTLPKDYELVIRLRILDGLPAADVGSIMGRSPDAIRQLQHRALTALRHALGESLPEGTSS